MSKKIAAHHDAAHDEHRPNVGKYLAVFGALMVLTGVTVAVSKLHLERPQAIAVGLFIASIKAALVAGIFMHLWGENRLIYKVLGITAACAAILLLPMIDMHLIAPRVTMPMAVAAQHPDEGSEARVTETMQLPAPAPAAKPAAKTAKHAKAKAK